MHSINELKVHNLRVIDEVTESNQTEKIAEDGTPRGVKILGAAIAAINRKKIKDPEKQKREIRKIRNNYN
jgi:hypothetical protein